MRTSTILLLTACLFLWPTLAEAHDAGLPAQPGIDGAVLSSAAPSGPNRSPLATQSPAATRVATLLEYTLPVTPTNLLIDNSGIWFSSFNQEALGFLDPGSGPAYLYDFAGRGSLFEVAADASDGIWYSSTNASSGSDSVGVLNRQTGVATDWTLPRNHFGLHFDPTSNDVWFVSKGLADGQIARLKPGTNQVTVWNISPYTDTYDLDLAPGGPVWFTVQPRGLQGVGRLNGLTGEVRIWTMPAAASRPFRILAASDEEVWLTEFGSTGNSISRLTPSANRLEQYRVPPAANGPAGFVKIGDEVWFAAYEGNSIGRLDLTRATPVVTQVTMTPFVAPATTNTITPSSFTPTVRKVAAPATRVTVAGTVYDAFTVFTLPQPNSKPFDLATADAARQVWFTEGNAPRIGALVPWPSRLFLPVIFSSS